MIKQDLTARMDEACKGCDEGKGKGRARELLNVQAQAGVRVNTQNKLDPMISKESDMKALEG